jgi:uncharacterized protein YdcH (DUF465 family)
MTQERYNHRIKHLEELHHILNKKIDGMESTGVFEDTTLEVLKKQRLFLKDEIATLLTKQQHGNKHE